MAYISKEKVKQIIANAPKGSDPKMIIRGLIDRGNQLEGFTAPVAPVPPSQAESMAGSIIGAGLNLVPGSKEIASAGMDTVRGIGEGIGQMNKGVGNVTDALFPRPQLETETKKAVTTQNGTTSYIPALDETFTVEKPSTATAEQRLKQGVSGVQDIIQGGLNASFAPGGAVVNQVPVAREVVGAGMDLLSKGSQSAADIFKTTMGIDPESQESKIIDQGFNILGNLLAIKLPTTTPAKKLAGKVGEAMGDLKQGAKEVLKPVANKVPGLKDLDTIIDRGIEKGIRPTVVGKKNLTQMNEYFSKARDAVKSIVENKKDLKLTDDFGDISKKSIPQNLRQFSEALDQTKSAIFKKYDAMAKTAGEKGASVNLIDTAKELQKVAEDVTLQDMHPEVIKYAQDRADALMNRGQYSATQAQEAIKMLNDKLQAFYRNPTPDMFAKVNVDAMIANQLRKGLDSSIEGLVGKGYQELKNKYGALKSIEKDLNHRMLVDARKNNVGLVESLGNIGSAAEVVRGVVSMNPATIAGGLAIKGINKWLKKLNDPNNAIKSMFKEVEKRYKPEAKAPLKPAGKVAVSGKPIGGGTIPNPLDSLLEKVPGADRIFPSNKNPELVPKPEITKVSPKPKVEIKAKVTEVKAPPVKVQSLPKTKGPKVKSKITSKLKKK